MGFFGALLTASRAGRCRARASIELAKRRLTGFEESDDGEDASVDVGGSGDFELDEDVLDVLFDCAVGYPEGLCDTGVRLPLGHERKYFTFSRRERVEGVCPPSGREQFDDEPGVEDGAAFADPRERVDEFIEVGH